MLKTISGWSVLTLLLAGCSVSGPVVMTTSKGRILRGQAQADLSNAIYEVTDGRIKCSGTWDQFDPAREITASIRCSDGRTGLVKATRNEKMDGGVGTVQFSDGSTARLVFGPAKVDQ